MKLTARLLPLLLVILAVGASGCANTVRGVAKDLKQTGQAVDDAVN